MVTHNSDPKPRLSPIEYLFLLPAILSLSPLISAWRLSQTVQDQNNLIFLFRLLTLAHLLIVSAIILYFWRPSLRRKRAFIRNMTIVTCLGILAVMPIVLTYFFLGNTDLSKLTIFSSTEVALASITVAFCTLINISCLMYVYHKGSGFAHYGRWEGLSIIVLLTLCGVLMRSI